MYVLEGILNHYQLLHYYSTMDTCIPIILSLHLFHLIHYYNHVLMKALKCKTLRVELAHAVQYNGLLRSTTIYLRLTLVGNGRQMNLSRTSTLMNGKWPCESEKEARTQERKCFSEICQLENSAAQQRPGW